MVSQLYITEKFFPTAFKGCVDIVFTRVVQLGGRKKSFSLPMKF